MNQNKIAATVREVGMGLAFILFPLIFSFAFAVHPDLLKPQWLGPAALIARARQNDLLQFGHMLVTCNTMLLIAVALHFMGRLDQTHWAWAGRLGGVLAIAGAVILAADKGALCLTMSALDRLPDAEFAHMMPGLLMIFNKEGWLGLLWGILCLPLGFLIQAAALLKTRMLPRWQGGLFLVGVLLVGTPDGCEMINLTASICMAIAFIPYGVRMAVKSVKRSAANGCPPGGCRVCSKCMPGV